MRIERIQMLKDIQQMLSGASFAYFISYQGVTVAQFRALRKDLKGCNATCKVLKNTLLRKYYAQAGLTQIAEHDALKRDTAVIFGAGDAAAAAKVLDKFGNDKVSAKFGLCEGAVLTATEVKAIADLPTREVLYAQLLGVIQGPARNLVSLLAQAGGGSVVNVINAHKNKLEESN